MTMCFLLKKIVVRKEKNIDSDVGKVTASLWAPFPPLYIGRDRG